MKDECLKCGYWIGNGPRYKCYTDTCPAKIRDNENPIKYFEKKRFQDGGPNDKGEIIGYIKAKNLDEVKSILNVNHGFIQVFEISKVEFYKRKSQLKKELRMFNI